MGRALRISVQKATSLRLLRTSTGIVPDPESSVRWLWFDDVILGLGPDADGADGLLLGGARGEKLIKCLSLSTEYSPCP